MGCGISRFDPRLHDKDHDDHDRIGDGREDRLTKNNNGGKGRLLFIKKSSAKCGGGGNGGCRRSVSSPSNNSVSPINNHNHVKHIASLQHHRRGERPNVAGKRKSGRDDIDNKDLERSEIVNNINCISRGGDEEDDEEGSRRRKCISRDSVDDINVDDHIEGSSIMFRGSPSFREYCRPDDDDDDHINTNNIDKEEMRKKTAPGIRGENIKVSNKGSGGSSMAAAVKKGVRRFRKVSPNHSPSPPPT